MYFLAEGYLFIPLLLHYQSPGLRRIGASLLLYRLPRFATPSLLFLPSSSPLSTQSLLRLSPIERESHVTLPASRLVTPFCCCCCHCHRPSASYESFFSFQLQQQRVPPFLRAHHTTRSFTLQAVFLPICNSRLHQASQDRLLVRLPPVSVISFYDQGIIRDIHQGS